MKLKRALTQKLVKKIHNFLFLGKIVTERVVDQEKQSLLFYEDEDHIRFYVECLSPIPSKLKASFSTQDVLFVGTTANKNNESKIKPWIKSKKKDDIIDGLKKVFDSKLVMFRLEYANEVITADLVEFFDGKRDSFYHLLPVIELRGDGKREEVENRLIKGSLPIHLPKYFNDFEQPEFIFYENRLYGNLFLKSMMNDISYLEKQNEVTFQEYDENELKKSFIHLNNLIYFIPEKQWDELKKDFKKECRELIYTQEFTEKQPFPIEWSSDSENAFIERFYQNCLQQGLLYEKKDIINFHICCKFQALTILGGVSGTGKSQLARVYGETLGLEFGKELLFVPISPSYREHYDLLGYLNPATGIYIDSETGLTKLLIEAEQFPHRMYMVIFDEMNLSQIEHWFSKFLSILEMPQDKRVITLFHDHNVVINQYYKPKVKIGNNIIFVGTVNFDETSSEFSLRLLDRVNIISLRSTSFVNYAEKMSNENIYENVPQIYINAESFNNWTKKTFSSSELTNDELKFFDEFNKIVEQSLSERIISPRMIKDLSNYLANIPTLPSHIQFERREAIDLFVKQRVLTKVRGLFANLEELIGTGEGNEQEGLLNMIMKSNLGRSISDFENSIKELKKKRKQLEIDGYVN
ncbi:MULTISPECIES: hypothetical protein [unclassified Bacillus (in: firmicutes)]|uniref:hypothetical protein n=1 Tax=unclassified Bacillus (in: firmicutes) TaxID=185979 RepID=UPI001155F445|nr:MULTISPECIES: hypothetical protein [unclassified Bacillus (in: firmicutes)]